MNSGSTDGIFQAIGSKARLVDRVVDEIQRLIFEGALKPGTKLPPEREFADQIGVSRTVVREAVHILVTKGLLETRQGVGTVVREMSNDRLIEPLSMMLQTKGISLYDLHQVRSILEVAIVGLAATQATRQDLAQLERIMSEMEENIGHTDVFIACDAEFHQTLAQTAHNPLLVMLLDSIRDLMTEVRIQVHREPEIYATVVPDHREILERIEAHDAEAARQAMLRHLEHALRLQNLVLGRS